MVNSSGERPIPLIVKRLPPPQRATGRVRRGVTSLHAPNAGTRAHRPPRSGLLALVRHSRGAIKGEPGQLVSYLVSTEGGHNTSRIGSCNAQMFHKDTVRCLSHLGTACSARTASPVMVITFGTATARKIRQRTLQRPTPRSGREGQACSVQVFDSSPAAFVGSHRRLPMQLPLTWCFSAVSPPAATCFVSHRGSNPSVTHSSHHCAQS